MKRYFTILFLFCISVAALAGVPQNQRDSLVKLLNAEYVKQHDLHGIKYRIVKGPATFLHNGAYLFCDSSAWDLQRNVINAYGNVRIIQDGTILKSEHLIYEADNSLAKFDGELVELSDRDGNTLRTNNLDYHTKDSVAVFRHGGAVRDTSGTVIEGDTGTYDSKTSIFSFQGNVEMLTTDSLFIKTTNLKYDNPQNKAFFGRRTYMWEGDGLLFTNNGWYDRVQNVVYFDRDVYMNTPDYEVWCDFLTYMRATSDVEMKRNVLILNEERSTALVSHKAEAHTDSLSNVYAKMTEKPALIYYGENENHVQDSMFVASDTINVYTRRACDIPQSEFDNAAKEKEDIFFDAIAEADKKAAEEYNKKKAEAIAKRPENVARQKRMKLAAKASADSLFKLGLAVPDSLIKIGELKASDYMIKGAASDSLQPAVKDSLSTALTEDMEADASKLKPDKKTQPADTLKAANDSTLRATDTTQLRFVQMFRNVRMFRSDMQVVCDSASFCEVDSIARLFNSPIMWNEGRNQLTSNTMRIFVKDGGFERGSLDENALIISQEDTVHFNQIKSSTMIGYFKDNQLYRFDALGGVNAMFYMREREVITTVNIKEARTLMVTMRDGTAERLKYYEQVQSNAHPVTGLSIDDQRLKGFQWHEEKRPKDRKSITLRVLKNSVREEYDDISLPKFKTIDNYYQSDFASASNRLTERRRAYITARRERMAEMRQRQEEALEQQRREREFERRYRESVEAQTAENMAYQDSIINAIHHKDTLVKAQSDSLVSGPFRDTLISATELQVPDSLVKKPFRDTIIPEPVLVAKDTTVDKAPAQSQPQPQPQAVQDSVRVEITNRKGDVIADVIVSKDSVVEVRKEKLNLFQRWKLNSRIRKAKRSIGK